MLINGNSQLKTYNETQTLYKLCGFDDMNGDGVIEKPSISNGWKTKEGYKEEADINKDGKIISVEARYYLWSLANIKLEVKKSFPLSMDDQQAIRDLFVDVYDKACGRSGVNEKVRFAIYFGSLESEMNLRRDNIGDEGSKPLSEVLKVNKSIKNLFLGINNIGDIGAQFLSEALKINKTLTELDLWSNNIGANGAKSLSEALKVNDTLAELNLWGNNLGDEGAKALAEAIKVNKGLARIDLGTNNIGDVGARALAEAIKVNKNVTVLYLYGNKISDEAQGLLAKAVVARQAEGKPVRIIVSDYPGARSNN